MSYQMKSGQCDDPVVDVVDDGVVAEDVARLADAEDEAGLGIDPQLGHEVHELPAEILMV